MSAKNVSVQTMIRRNRDGKTLINFVDQWFGVSDEVIMWLVGSCSVTASKLAALREDHGPDSYTILYRTIVTKPDGTVASDTTLLPFEYVNYDDMVKFERWAIGQLDEMVDEFEAEHKQTGVPVWKARSLWATVWRVIVARVRNKMAART